jgi:hypothetical protein
MQISEVKSTTVTLPSGFVLAVDYCELQLPADSYAIIQAALITHDELLPTAQPLELTTQDAKAKLKALLAGHGKNFWEDSTFFSIDEAVANDAKTLKEWAGKDE